MKKILIIFSLIIVGLFVIIIICVSFYLYSYVLVCDNFSMNDIVIIDEIIVIVKLVKKNWEENVVWMEK